MAACRLMSFGAIFLSVAFLSARAQSPPTRASTSLGLSSAQIAFASNRDGNWEIYVTDASGRSQRRLTRREVQDRFPLWSPNGAQIAFGSQVNQRWELWVMIQRARQRQRTHRSSQNRPGLVSRQQTHRIYGCRR